MTSTRNFQLMKLFNAIAAAALIGTSLTAANPAKAAGCYPSLAAGVMVPIIRETGNVPLAAQAAREEGYLDVTESCTYRVISYIKRYAHVIY